MDAVQMRDLMEHYGKLRSGVRPAKETSVGSGAAPSMNISKKRRIGVPWAKAA